MKSGYISMYTTKHYAAAISAFVIWGFFSIPLRALSAYPAGEILYFRILLSLMVLFLIIGLFKRKQLKEDLLYLKTLSYSRQKSVIGLTLLGGILLTVNWLTFIYIVNNINIKTASFSYLLCPVITAVSGYMLLKEKLTVLQWGAVALCGVSCILMGMHSASELGYSVLTALTYALFLVTQRKNQGFDRIILLGIQILFSFLILSVLHRQLLHGIPGDSYFYIIVLLISVVFTVLPLFLNLFALNQINSATIGILMYINPILNFGVALFVFHETIQQVQVAGYSIIGVALIMFNYPNLQKLRALEKRTRD